jgi:hypothetical protein
MIKPEQIPDEVVKAALLTDERLGMRVVIAAALAAWPGSQVRLSMFTPQEEIILRLPQEPRT